MKVKINIIYKDIVSKFHDYNLIWIEEYSPFKYYLYFSPDKELMFDSLSEEFEYFSENTFINYVDIPSIHKDGRKINLLIVKFEIPKSFSYSVIQEDNKKYFTIKEIKEDFQNVLLGAYRNSLDDDNEYIEFIQGEPIPIVFAKLSFLDESCLI